MLKYMDASVAGVTVPKALIDRMNKAKEAAGDDKKKMRELQEAEGLKITVELIHQILEIPASKAFTSRPSSGRAPWKGSSRQPGCIRGRSYHDPAGRTVYGGREADDDHEQQVHGALCSPCASPECDAFVVFRSSRGAGTRQAGPVSQAYASYGAVDVIMYQTSW